MIDTSLIKFINEKSIEDDLLFAAEDILKKRRGDYYLEGSRPLPNMSLISKDKEILNNISKVSPKLKEYIDKTYPNTYLYAFDMAEKAYKKATCFKLNPSNLEITRPEIRDKNAGWSINFNGFSDRCYQAKEVLEKGKGYIEAWNKVFVALPYDTGIITNPTLITIVGGEIHFYDQYGMFYYISKIAEYLQNNPNTL